MDRYRAFKQTATHADVLTAIGAADLLRHLDPRIVDCGDRFEVRLRRTLRRSDLTSVDPGFSYLTRPKKTAPDVPPERIIRTGVPYTTVAENRMYSVLGRMKAYGGPNELISRFARVRREEWESRIWECLHGATDFVFRSPLVQLFDPYAAKGYALLKPCGTNRNDKTKNLWAQPFEQWLRYRGYFEGCAGWFTSGDLRVFCPTPADIAYEEFAPVAGAFRQLNLGGTAVKMDCRAVLGLTKLLIERTNTKRTPRGLVSGVWVTHYKDMGHAHAVIAMDQLAIPAWVESNAALPTLEEHDIALRRLNDSHSDEFALLKQYRRTFQTNRQESIAEFAVFLSAYGSLVFRRRAQDHWILPQFSLNGITPILGMSPEYGMILDNPGFMAVAAAVRSATVGAQGARHMGNVNHREIRYGLLSDIHRAGLVGQRELVSAISEFVGGFNAETMRRHRAGTPSSRIQNTEISAFSDLLNRTSQASLVGTLLTGLSTCRRMDQSGEPIAVEDKSELVHALSA
jgi:hypothetical protein